MLYSRLEFKRQKREARESKKAKAYQQEPSMKHKVTDWQKFWLAFIKKLFFSRLRSHQRKRKMKFPDDRLQQNDSEAIYQNGRLSVSYSHSWILNDGN